MTKVELGQWTAWARSGPVPPGIPAEFPARAPGSIHTDLMAAGALPDPLQADEELHQHWIGLVDWSMATQFALDRPGPATLCLDGVDTIATVRVDDVEVARLENMHRRYRIDLGELATGSHRVQVDFDSPVRAADRRSLEQGMRPHVNTHPFNAIRKMACSFGWDWGPDTATSGLWRPAWVELGRAPRLDGLVLRASCGGEGGRLVVDSGEGLDHLEVGVFGQGVDQREHADGSSLEMRLPRVERWWPNGLGEQTLYRVEVRATRGDETTIEQRQVGFRQAQWRQDETDRGRDFRLVVNDRPVWVRGVNWIPDDPFPHRVERARLREALGDAVDLGCNLVRVWGGGTWESDDFYDLCDELGLLVWQDATFACAFYDESEPMWVEVEAELVDNLTRIGHHASLVLVNGGNENEIMGRGRGWQDARDPDLSWGLGYWRDLVPRVAAERVPHVQCIPNSPFSPDVSHDPNDQTQGTIHIWDLWNSRLYWDYRSYRPSFAAEFGWQGPPAWQTLRTSIRDDPMTPVSPQVLLHQKAGAGQLKIQRGIVKDFGVQPDMRRWHWAAQLVQARALHTAVDWFRSLPECGGTVVWQLNDCWPAISWAVVDDHGWRKPAYHALQRAYAPRTAGAQLTGTAESAPRLHLSNHSTDEWRAAGSVTLHAADGDTLATQQVDSRVDALAFVDIALADELSTPAAGCFLRVDVAGAPRQQWWPCGPEVEPLMAAEFDLVVEEDAVTVRARSVVRELWLAIDEIVNDVPARQAQPLVCGEQLVTLLPGEEHRWELAGLDWDHQEVSVRSAVKCANDLADHMWRRR